MRQSALVWRNGVPGATEAEQGVAAVERGVRVIIAEPRQRGVSVLERRLPALELDQARGELEMRLAEPGVGGRLHEGDDLLTDRQGLGLLVEDLEAVREVAPNIEAKRLGGGKAPIAASDRSQSLLAGPFDLLGGEEQRDEGIMSLEDLTVVRAVGALCQREGLRQRLLGVGERPGIDRHGADVEERLPQVRVVLAIDLAIQVERGPERRDRLRVPRLRAEDRAEVEVIDGADGEGARAVLLAQGQGLAVVLFGGGVVVLAAFAEQAAIVEGVGAAQAIVGEPPELGEAIA